MASYTITPEVSNEQHADSSLVPQSASLRKILPVRLHTEKDLFFFYFLAIIEVVLLGFALISWAVDYRFGLITNLLAILGVLALGALRIAGVNLKYLRFALQAAALVHGGANAWMTGGIYSPTIGWLALAPLPAMFMQARRTALAWLGLVCLTIFGLYLHALFGGSAEQLVAPQHLVHWHVIIALVICVLQVVLLRLYELLRNQRLRRLNRSNHELQHTRNQLLAAQEHKDRFVATVSHELRTPMNAILGLADLLHHDRELPEASRHKVDGIRKSAEHLLTVINDLLDFTQIQAGKLKIAREPFDLHDTLRTAHSLLRGRAESKPLKYALEIAPDVPEFIVGDRHRLTQVLVNLLGNAVKFTSEGEVSMICRCLVPAAADGSGCVVQIAVRDSGIGIPEDRQAAVFEHFTQADTSISTNYGGNGLGLAISQRLVHEMNGRIHLTSEPGIGSTFFVDLNVELSRAPAKALVERPTEHSAAPLRILVADDNQINRQVASLQLRRHLPQAVIEEAANGVEAVAKVRSGKFNIVLMDVLMPEMDGFEATRLIRSDLPEPERSIPIIALTANTNVNDLNRCLEAGMNETLLKPFDKKALIEKVLFYGLRTHANGTH